MARLAQVIVIISEFMKNAKNIGKPLGNRKLGLNLLKNFSGYRVILPCWRITVIIEISIIEKRKRRKERPLKGFERGKNWGNVT